MGSDWDAESDEDFKPTTAPVVVPKKASKFADEDASDEDVKDEWDASDDEEEKKPAAPTGPPPPVRAKGITKQKIAEREAAEAAAAAEEAALRNDTPQDRKARERAAMLKADMDNAASLLGGVTMSDDLLTKRRVTAPDFAELSSELSEQILKSYGQSALYAKFVEDFVKAICEPLKDIEVRRAASGLTALSNEKQKAQKDAASGKKKKGAAKPTLGMGRAPAAADTRAYVEAMDDADYDDDFM